LFLSSLPCDIDHALPERLKHEATACSYLPPWPSSTEPSLPQQAWLARPRSAYSSWLALDLVSRYGQPSVLSAPRPSWRGLALTFSFFRDGPHLCLLAKLHSGAVRVLIPVYRGVP